MHCGWRCKLVIQIRYLAPDHRTSHPEATGIRVQIRCQGLFQVNGRKQKYVSKN